MSYQAHETAVIDAGCEIGEGTHIWHFSHIMTGCVIGRACNIGQNVVVSPGVVLGNNVKVQNNVSVLWYTLRYRFLFAFYMCKGQKPPAKTPPEACYNLFLICYLSPVSRNKEQKPCLWN